MVLQRGFPLPGINFDSPGATRKKLPAKRRGVFLPKYDQTVYIRGKLSAAFLRMPARAYPPVRTGNMRAFMTVRKQQS